MPIQTIASELNISTKQVEATLALLQEGATIPFIARYRKEATFGLDEVQLAQIRDRHAQIQELEHRRKFILQTIEAQGNLTPEIAQKITAATNIAQLEDLYLPYKPKRRTRAAIAREKGLEPLANLILLQQNIDLLARATEFIQPEKGVNTYQEALDGARDIIAEGINENIDVRTRVRKIFLETSALVVKLADENKKEEAAKYRDYFEFDGQLKQMPSHRLLAILRGEREGFLKVNLEPDAAQAFLQMEKISLKASNECAEQVKIAIADAYKRLLKPSLENETLATAKTKADLEAIAVFRENLKELLMASPLGEKRTLAIDPGFRTGCKVVCLDEQGKLVENTVIYLLSSDHTQAQKTIEFLCKKHQIQAIAIGNGTASRETEAFVKKLGLNMPIILVNESGASIYSASELAREEFPDHDITVRGAVSIGRRLIDPLAELVKIDPKSIGVGQYQHDVEQNALKHGLDDVVISCVNSVGVELNTASKQILSYVSGLGPTLAQNIVDYRNENGAFSSRAQLKKVPRLGEKAYEQAAGFLRIRGAKNPLDSSAVHPERYDLVAHIAKDAQTTVQNLMQNAELRKTIDLKKYLSAQVGLPTLQDIFKELEKPGRDPRQQFEAFEFAQGIEKPQDLSVGMHLPGVVTNVTAFGAFVDVGVHQDGLVHISQLADRFVKNPSDVVKVGQKVMAWVTEIDLGRKRISLSIRKEMPVNS